MNEPTSTLWKYFKVVLVISSIIGIFAIITVLCAITYIAKVKDESGNPVVTSDQLNDLLKYWLVFILPGSIQIPLALIGVYRPHLESLYAYLIIGLIGNFIASILLGFQLIILVSIPAVLVAHIMIEELREANNYYRRTPYASTKLQTSPV